MNRPPSSRACTAAASVLLATTVAFIPLLAMAQQNAATVESTASAGTVNVATPLAQPEPDEALTRQDRKLEVGDSTRRLLAMQRDGSAASTTPRPLAGEVASLSYKRYLDSFKFPIPERFGAAVQKSGSTGSR